MSNKCKKSVDMIKNEIVDKAGELLYEDRLYLLKIITQHISNEKIQQHADGVRINLKNFSNNLIHKIHHIIINRLKVSDDNRI